MIRGYMSALIWDKKSSCSGNSCLVQVSINLSSVTKLQSRARRVKGGRQGEIAEGKEHLLTRRFVKLHGDWYAS